MRLFLIAMFLFVLPWFAEAARPVAPEYDDQALDFSLRIARLTAPLNYDGLSVDTSSRWLGVSLREKASRYVTLGMYGGYAYLTQTGNPITAGQELAGYHAGFMLHGVILAGQRASLYYTLNYTYQKVDHQSDTQSVVIDWAQPQAQLGATLLVTSTLSLLGGGNYGYLDGEERTSGTVNRTINFKRESRAGGFFGLDLMVDPGGYVGIVGHSGLTRSGEIYFKRSF